MTNKTHLFSKFVSKLMALLLAVGMLAGIVPETIYAASTDSISVSGTYNYSMANSVLTEVNNQRSKAGLSKLTMDKALMDEAMKRAAEISVYLSHTRPNGSDCYTAYSKLGNSRGENIAAGQSSASAVMNSWMSSTGHKKNILDKDFKSIGIGSFTTNGVTYWVQVFSSSSATSVSKSGTSNVNVSVSVKSSYLGSLSLTPASSSINKGKTTSITAYLKNKGDTRFKAKINASSLKWSSGSTSVATVNSSGTVTGKKAGSAKITAKTSAGSASASTTITVKDSGSTTTSTSTKTKLSSCTISLSKTSYTYDGTAKKPTVTVKNGSKTLKSGTNYSVSYKNNTNAGTATVTVTGKGNYTGSVTKNFKINAAKISGCTISLSKTSYTYDGTAKKPSVTVKNGSKTLKSGTDYSVSYKNNTNVGTASAVITGKGNYTGSVNKNFTIKKDTSSTTTVNDNKPATTAITSLTSPASGQMTVKWSKVSGADGYVIMYSDNPNFYTTRSYDTREFEDITKDPSVFTYTFSGLQKGKTYYVRMKTYRKDTGKKTYSSWSASKSVKIAK